MMQMKFNFDNFIFYGLCLPQLGSVPAAYAVVAGDCESVIGLSNNDVISLRSLRHLRYFCYVLYVASVALDGIPA